MQPGPFLKETIIVHYLISMLPILAATCLSQSLPVRAEDYSSLPPKPAWVTMVDQKASDARLAGYATPQEVKLELVTEISLFALAGQIAFAPDGTFLVLQWTPGGKKSYSMLNLSLLPNSPIRFGESAHQEAAVTALTGSEFNQKKWLERDILSDVQPVSTMLLDGKWLYTFSNGMVQRRHRDLSEWVFEQPEIIARGFGGRGPQPSCGLSFDLTGSLIIAVGPGDHHVVGTDGSKAEALDTGAVFRCRADGSKVELLATGLSSPDGAVVFDREAHAFLAGTTAGRNGSTTNILHLTEGSDYGFRSLLKTQPELEDLARKSCLRDLPGVMKPIISMPGKASGGMCIYNDSRFPPFFQGLLLCPSPATHSVKAFRINGRASSFAVSEAFDLVHSTDATFTPWQVVVGPDGGIYVLDCMGRNTRNERGLVYRKYGRLFRLSWKGGPAHPGIELKGASSWSAVASMKDAELIKTLAAPDFTDRQLAQRELIHRGKINQAALVKGVNDPELSTDSRALAAGALCTMWDDAIKGAFLTLATDDDTLLRRLAAEALGRHSAPKDPQIQEVLLRILGDPDPATRRSVALAMARVGASEAPDCIAGALSFDIGTDLSLRDGLVRSLERLGKPGLEQILKLANSGEADRLELAVNAFCALRTPAGATLLPQLLNNPHLANSDRVRLIRSLARYRVDGTAGTDGDLPGIVPLLDASPELWFALLEVAQARVLKGCGGFVSLSFSLIPK